QNIASREPRTLTIEVKPFHFGRRVRRPRLHRKAYSPYRFCQASVLLHASPCFRHTYFSWIRARTEPVGHSPTARCARPDDVAVDPRTTRPTASAITQDNDLSGMPLPCAPVRTVSTRRRIANEARPSADKGRASWSPWRGASASLLLGPLLD